MLGHDVVLAHRHPAFFYAQHPPHHIGPTRTASHTHLNPAQAVQQSVAARHPAQVHTETRQPLVQVGLPGVADRHAAPRARQTQALEHVVELIGSEVQRHLAAGRHRPGVAEEAHTAGKQRDRFERQVHPLRGGFLGKSRRQNHGGGQSGRKTTAAKSGTKQTRGAGVRHERSPE